MTSNEQPTLNTASLSTWLREHVPGFSGPLTVERFSGGQSNPTFKLITPARAYVLRRKPPGVLVAGAHAIEREAKVMTALKQVGFPVPDVLGLCTDDQVIGSWFYVMEMVEGRIFWDATFPTAPSHQRPLYFDAMNATLAQLHNVDFRAIGLSEFGRHENYLARQIARWTKQYRDDPDAGRDANMERLADWLAVNIPSGDETSVVHGDFRCDNMIFHPTDPKVIAVLDWELSTLGHPIADFAYHAMMYRMPPDIVAGLRGADLVALNIPDERQYVQRYCDLTGRRGIPNYEFYMAFNLFRLAAIFHGIRGRFIRGSAASAQAEERGKNFPRLAELAAQAMYACA